MEMENYSSVILTDREWDYLGYFVYTYLFNKHQVVLSENFKQVVRQIFVKINKQLDGDIDVESESE